MASVFLSYDHEDAVLAKPLVAALERAGHTVWYDRHIHGGAQYSSKIEQALEAADAVIVLWSPRSVESAWVRDEAAEGRNRNKLVPLSIDGVSPPMGFRQFQTIDLGAWKGRGKVPNLDELLQAIDSQSAQTGPRPVAPVRHGASPARPARPPRPSLILVAGLVLVAAAVAGTWWWRAQRSLPVVAIAAANQTGQSQAAASDLYVKLGSLAQVGEGKWQLVEDGEGTRPDLLFRTADFSSPSEPRASLVLVDGSKGALLWSREFSVPSGALADLRQQVSLTAGRVLGCALESRDAGGLRPDLYKLFLNACAMAAETSNGDPDRIAGLLRTIVTAAPDFTPAWSHLLNADGALFDNTGFGQGDRPSITRLMKADIENARKAAPNLPQIALAEIKLLPQTAYGQTLDLIAKAAAQAPDNAVIQAEHASALQRVGLMTDSIRSARRAAELDPLSPGISTLYVLTLAYAGQLEEARRELARAEKLWAGTGALRDAMWAFHLRFGDPAMARRYAPIDTGDGLQIYLDARASRSPAAIDKLIDHASRAQSATHSYGWALQAFAEFGHVDEAFARIANTPTDTVAEGSYLLFRAPTAKLREDPRFMAVAGRIGLIDFWRNMDKWPDFCRQPGLPYDCKSEAAKYVG